MIQVPSTFPHFLEMMLSFSSHPSFRIAHLCLQYWVRLLTAQTSNNVPSSHFVSLASDLAGIRKQTERWTASSIWWKVEKVISSFWERFPPKSISILWVGFRWDGCMFPSLSHIPVSSSLSLLSRSPYDKDFCTFHQKTFRYLLGKLYQEINRLTPMIAINFASSVMTRELSQISSQNLSPTLQVPSSGPQPLSHSSPIILLSSLLKRLRSFCCASQTRCPYQRLRTSSRSLFARLS